MAKLKIPFTFTNEQLKLSAFILNPSTKLSNIFSQNSICTIEDILENYTNFPLYKSFGKVSLKELNSKLLDFQIQCFGDDTKKAEDFMLRLFEVNA